MSTFGKPGIFFLMALSRSAVASSDENFDLGRDEAIMVNQARIGTRTASIDQVSKVHALFSNLRDTDLYGERGAVETAKAILVGMEAFYVGIHELGVSAETALEPSNDGGARRIIERKIINQEQQLINLGHLARQLEQTCKHAINSLEQPAEWSHDGLDNRYLEILKSFEDHRQALAESFRRIQRLFTDTWMNDLQVLQNRCSDAVHIIISSAQLESSLLNEELDRTANSVRALQKFAPMIAQAQIEAQKVFLDLAEYRIFSAKDRHQNLVAAVKETLAQMDSSTIDPAYTSEWRDLVVLLGEEVDSALSDYEHQGGEAEMVADHFTMNRDGWAEDCRDPNRRALRNCVLLRNLIQDISRPAMLNLTRIQLRTLEGLLDRVAEPAIREE